MFSIRIVTTDHCLATPVAGLDACRSEFRGREVKKVPVIRIYGSTPKGQKTCMHVHGVFPYIYVPHDASVGDERPSEAFMQAMASSVDRALNMSMGNPTSGQQHVFKISAVSGTALYGFHHKESYFLKLYFYNPYMVYRAADLLLSGAVMHRSFQPHEAHVPYMLQFFIDYCLYGMNMINVSAAKFRLAKDQIIAEPCSRAGGTVDGKWNPSLLAPDLVLDPEAAAKMSTCELEVDVMAEDILNRTDAQATFGTNPGLLALWTDEQFRRKSKGLSSQVAMQPSQAREPYKLTELENKWLDRFHEVVSQVTVLPEYDHGSFVVPSDGLRAVFTTAESVNEDSVKDVVCFTQRLESAAHILDQDGLAALLADMAGNDSLAFGTSQLTQSSFETSAAPLKQPSLRSEGVSTLPGLCAAPLWTDLAEATAAANSQLSLCSSDNLYRWSQNQEATTVSKALDSSTESLEAASAADAAAARAPSRAEATTPSPASSPRQRQQRQPSLADVDGESSDSPSRRAYASCFSSHAADDDAPLAPGTVAVSPDDDALETVEMSQLVWDVDEEASPAAAAVSPARCASSVSGPRFVRGSGFVSVSSSRLAGSAQCLSCSTFVLPLCLAVPP